MFYHNYFSMLGLMECENKYNTIQYNSIQYNVEVIKALTYVHAHLCQSNSLTCVGHCLLFEHDLNVQKYKLPGQRWVRLMG
jgi:hypothetical protein